MRPGLMLLWFSLPMLAQSASSTSAPPSTQHNSPIKSATRKESSANPTEPTTANPQSAPPRKEKPKPDNQETDGDQKTGHRQTGTPSRDWGLHAILETVLLAVGAIVAVRTLLIQRAELLILEGIDITPNRERVISDTHEGAAFPGPSVISASIQNFGRTAACRVTARMWCGIPDKLTEQPRIQQAAIGAGYGFSVRSKPVNSFTDEAAYQMVLEERLPFVVLVDIAYRDVFGFRHEGQRKWALRFDRTGINTVATFVTKSAAD